MAGPRSSRDAMQPSGASGLKTCILFTVIRLAGAISFDCGNVLMDGYKFDLSPLDGPHSVWTIDEHEPTYSNTTFTLDLCQPLKKSNGEDCPNGSRGTSLAAVNMNQLMPSSLRHRTSLSSQ